MTDPISSNNLKGAAGASGDDGKYSGDVFTQGAFIGGQATRNYSASNKNITDSRGKFFENLITDGAMLMTKCVYGTEERPWYIWDTARRNGNSCYALPLNGTHDTSKTDVSIYDGSISIANNTTGVNESNNVTFWCGFKCADSFFKITTYTGNGGNGDRHITHNLGCRPGMVWIKKYGGSGGNRDFLVWNAAMGETGQYRIDDENNWSSGHKIQIATGNSTTVVIPRSNSDVNENGGTYILYAFGDGSDTSYGVNGDKSIIKVGTYNATNSTSAGANLGWEPCIGFFKRPYRVSNAPNPSPFRGDPYIISEVTGFTAGNQYDSMLFTGSGCNKRMRVDNAMVQRTSTGFTVGANGDGHADTSRVYMYMCIARNERPAATDITPGQVIRSYTYSTGSSGLQDIDFKHAYEMAWFGYLSETNQHSQDSRMNVFRKGAWCSQRWLESLYSSNLSDMNDQNSLSSGLGIGGHPIAQDEAYVDKNSNYYRFGNRNPTANNQARATLMCRIPPIMDVLMYRGNGGGNRAIPHTLQAAPEALWFMGTSGDTTRRFFSKGKAERSGFSNKWWKYADSTASVNQGDEQTGNGNTNRLYAEPDETNIYVGSEFNQNNVGYYVTLWSSYSGIIKVGGYNGNGTNTGDSQNIACGFSTDKPAWLQIRRWTNPQDYDGGNNWYYFSAQRGFNDAGGGVNDRWLTPTSAKGTTNFGNDGNHYDQNIVNTYSGGFQVIQDNSQSISGGYSYRADLNKSGESYHYIAYHST